MKVICFLIHGIGPQQSEFAKKHTRRVDSCLTKLIAEGKKTAPDTLKGISRLM